MSLSIIVLQKDYFIVSSDSAVTDFPYDEELLNSTGEHVRIGDMIPTDFKSEKSEKLSNQVFMVSSGNSALVDILKGGIDEKTDVNFDLSNCVEVAKEVFRDMNDGKIRNLNEVTSRVTQKYKITSSESEIESELYKLLPRVKEPTDISSYLVGFNNDGTIGLYDIRTDNYYSAPKDETKPYLTIAVGHFPGWSSDPKNFSELQKELTLPVGHRTIENFFKVMTYVHAHISSESRINVSTDCTFDIVQLVDNELIHQQTVVETLDFYERLGLK